MKKFWKNPWTISIGTAIFAFLLTILRDLLKGKRILSTIWSILSAVWRAILTFLNFNLKVWWVLLGIAAVIAILWLLSKFDEKSSESKKPEFTSYTEDHFRTWKWSWKWEFSSYQKKWHVSNLVAHCPKCDTPMQHDQFEETYQCPRCRYTSQYDEHETRSQVEAVIIDNLNRKEKAGEQHEA